MEILFSHVSGTAWISASSKKFQKHLTLKCVCFSYFFLTIGIHFSHILGIVWVSASPKIFEKSITLECLFFPILSPYYGNSLFPYFGNCMGFCFTQNISETHKFEMFVFSHAFFILCKSTFPIFLELHGFLLQIKNLRNPYL